MRTNTRKNTPPIRTHEGAIAKRTTALNQLRRSVMSCLLWENEFYESGVSIAERIRDLCGKVTPEEIAEIAIEARHEQHLRHVPLLLLTELIFHGRNREDGLVRNTIARVVSRADEPGELLSLYWRRPGNKKMLPAQLKLGLAAALERFDEYQLAKYNRDTDVKIRDVLFLVHAKPKGKLREDLYKRLAANELETPDTWEVNLSAGADKKATFERMLRENSLGYMALIRNLRNMVEAGVDRDLVDSAIRLRAAPGARRVLPFRFIAAARHAPSFEPALDAAMMATVAEMPQFEGTTYVMVDVSGSMNHKLSGKSDMKRMDAACALAAIIPSKSTRVFSFSNFLAEVPARRGMAGVDAIISSQPHMGTDLAGAVRMINQMMRREDRLIVITDEQANDKRSIPDPECHRAYMINVAPYRNGVGYGKWTHIDGWSDGVFRFIHEAEAHPELSPTSDT